MYFMLLSEQTAFISLNIINELILEMVTGCVFFAVRAEFLNVEAIFDFSGLIYSRPPSERKISGRHVTPFTKTIRVSELRTSEVGMSNRWESCTFRKILSI
jgi:hypothetical protein